MDEELEQLKKEFDDFYFGCVARYRVTRGKHVRYYEIKKNAEVERLRLIQNKGIYIPIVIVDLLSDLNDVR